MRVLKAPHVSREDVEELEGVLSCDSHMYHPGKNTNHYPYLEACKIDVERKVKYLNACFLGNSQRNLEVVELHMDHKWIMLVLRDKRKNNDYFNLLEEVKECEC